MAFGLARDHLNRSASVAFSTTRSRSRQRTRSRSSQRTRGEADGATSDDERERRGLALDTTRGEASSFSARPIRSGGKDSSGGSLGRPIRSDSLGGVGRSVDDVGRSVDDVDAGPPEASTARALDRSDESDGAANDSDRSRRAPPAAAAAEAASLSSSFRRRCGGGRRAGSAVRFVTPDGAPPVGSARSLGSGYRSGSLGSGYRSGSLGTSTASAGSVGSASGCSYFVGSAGAGSLGSESGMGPSGRTSASVGSASGCPYLGVGLSGRTSGISSARPNSLSGSSVASSASDELGSRSTFSHGTALGTARMGSSGWLLPAAAAATISRGGSHPWLVFDTRLSDVVEASDNREHGQPLPVASSPIAGADGPPQLARGHSQASPLAAPLRASGQPSRATADRAQAPSSASSAAAAGPCVHEVAAVAVRRPGRPGGASAAAASCSPRCALRVTVELLPEAVPNTVLNTAPVIEAAALDATDSGYDTASEASGATPGTVGYGRLARLALAEGSAEGSIGGGVPIHPIAHRRTPPSPPSSPPEAITTGSSSGDAPTTTEPPTPPPPRRVGEESPGSQPAPPPITTPPISTAAAAAPVRMVTCAECSCSQARRSAGSSARRSSGPGARLALRLQVLRLGASRATSAGSEEGSPREPGQRPLFVRPRLMLSHAAEAQRNVVARARRVAEQVNLLREIEDEEYEWKPVSTFAIALSVFLHAQVLAG